VATIQGVTTIKDVATIQGWLLPYSLNISRIKIFTGKPDFLQKKYFVGNFSQLKRYKAPLIQTFKRLSHLAIIQQQQEVKHH